MLPRYLIITVIPFLLFCCSFPHDYLLTNDDIEFKLIEESKLNISKDEAIDTLDKYFNGTKFYVGLTGISTLIPELERKYPDIGYLSGGPAPNMVPVDTPFVIKFEEDGFSFVTWLINLYQHPDTLTSSEIAELDTVPLEKVYFNIYCGYYDSLTIYICPGTFCDIQAVDITWYDKSNLTKFDLGVRIPDTASFYRLLASIKTLMPDAVYMVIKIKDV